MDQRVKQTRSKTSGKSVDGIIPGGTIKAWRHAALPLHCTCSDPHLPSIVLPTFFFFLLVLLLCHRCPRGCLCWFLLLIIELSIYMHRAMKAEATRTIVYREGKRRREKKESHFSSSLQRTEPYAVGKEEEPSPDGFCASTDGGRGQATPAAPVGILAIVKFFLIFIRFGL